MMENKDYNQIIGNASAPYLNSLASMYAIATNYYADFHPSLPNYMAITGGSNLGITSDCNPSATCGTTDSSIFNLTSSHGLTWKVYAQTMPSNCYLSNYNSYDVYHNPALYYTSIGARQACKKYDVPMGTLSSGNLYDDVKGGYLPNFAMIIPNKCNDMHSCSISTGDKFLSNIVPLLQSSPQYSSSIIIITWDEGNKTDTANEGGHVATIIVGVPTLVNRGQFSTFYDHYSTLATIEDILGLGNLSRNDTSATPMSGIIPSLSTTATTTSSTSTIQSSSSSSTSTASTTSETFSTSTDSGSSSATTTTTTSTISTSSTSSAVFGVEGSAKNWANSVPSLSMSLATTKSSDLIVVFAVSANVHVTLTVSDTDDLVWNVRKSIVDSSFGTLYEFYAVAINALSPDSITVTQTKTDALRIIGFGVSGANIASPFDTDSGLPSVATGSSTTPSVGVSTSNANDIILGFFASSGKPTMSESIGFTSIGSCACSPSLAADYAIVSSTQNKLDVGYTLGTSEAWTMMGDAIVQASSGSSSAISNSFEFSNFILGFVTSLVGIGSILRWVSLNYEFLERRFDSLVV